MDVLIVLKIFRVFFILQQFDRYSFFYFYLFIYLFGRSYFFFFNFLWFQKKNLYLKLGIFFKKSFVYSSFLVNKESNIRYIRFLDIFNTLHVFSLMRVISNFSKILINVQEVVNLKIFTNPFFIVSLIVTNLENKKSRASFRKLFKLIEGRFSSLKGYKPFSFKVQCTGRSTKVKSLRTRFFVTKSGIPPFSYLSRPIRYASSTANTRFGLTNVEVWVYELIKKKNNVCTTIAKKNKI